jgi:hypothetical protein
MIVEPFEAAAARGAQRAEIELAHERGVEDRRPRRSRPRKIAPSGPRNSMPGRPRNMSVWSWRMKCITPLSSTAPVARPVERSKSWIVISEAGESARGAVVIVIDGWSLSNAMKTGTSPGRAASALASISSSGFRPTLARRSDAGHAILRGAFGQQVDFVMEDQRQAGDAQHQQESGADMLVHLWTRNQIRMVARRMKKGCCYCEGKSIAPYGLPLPLTTGFASPIPSFGPAMPSFGPSTAQFVLSGHGASSAPPTRPTGKDKFGFTFLSWRGLMTRSRDRSHRWKPYAF